jgi:hypothetical protein
MHSAAAANGTLAMRLYEKVSIVEPVTVLDVGELYVPRSDVVDKHRQ